MTFGHRLIVAAACIGVPMAVVDRACAETFKVAMLSGQQVSPPVATAASGCALFAIDTRANRLSYRIVFGGLTGAESGAYIHGPAEPGMNAAILQPLPPGNPKVGFWSYPEPLEGFLLAGRMYIIIRSSFFPNGEIRGQIVDMVARIDGAQQNPPIATPAMGFGLFDVDACANQVSYYIVFDGLTSPETAAHIHGFALQDTGAGALHTLPVGSPKTGTWSYEDAQERAILDGQTYVNIHSMNHAAGEIRGQVTRLVAPIDGLQAGVTTTDGRGCGLLAIDRAADTLSYSVDWTALTGPATAAHIHGFAPPGLSAGIKHDIGTTVPAKGVWTYSGSDETNVLDGLTYINVHTGANPDGEIRGQILFPEFLCLGDADCSGSVNVDDLILVILKWGDDDPNADVNGDGIVDVDDLLIVIINWGPCT